MKKEQNRANTTKRKVYSAVDRTNARRYYLMGLNLGEISLLLHGCPIRTLEKWQSTEKWTNLKNLENIKIRAYKLHQAGKTQKEIAEMLDICTVTVWRYISEVKAKG